MATSRRQFLLSLAGTAAHAQMLSRPGWRGTGLAPESWWRHAALVRFPAETTFADATKALDNILQIGVDSLLLPDPAPEPGLASTATSPLPFAARFGSEEDFDALLRETGARRMHVLFSASLNRLAANPGEVRFWMNRGIAGFDVGALTEADAGGLRLLRSSLARFPGERVVLAQPSSEEQGNTRTTPFTSATGTLLAFARIEPVPSTGETVALYVPQQASVRQRPVTELPVFSEAALSDADRPAIRHWLEAHRLGLRKTHGPAATVMDLGAPPPGSAHRRRRRSRSSGK